MALTEIKQAGLDDEAVNESKLQISNAGTNGQYLQKSSNTGGLTWADVPASVGGATGVDFNDGILVRWGTGNDFVINHIAGSYTQLDDATDSAVFFTTDNTTTGWQFRKRTGSEKCVEIYPDAGVNLYHNGVKSFETGGWGVGIHDDDTTVEATFTTSGGQVGSIYGTTTNTPHTFGFLTGTGEWTLRTKRDAAVELFYDNVKKAETASGGFTVTGTCTATSFAGDGSNLTGVSGVGGATGVDFNDTVKARWGTDNDLEIHHSSNGSYIKDTSANGLRINSANFGVNNAANDEQQLQCLEDGAVKLFHNGTMKTETNANGISVDGNVGFVSSGQGIDFGATANAANSSNRSELLDDYEQGTFTPTLFLGNTEASYDAANTEGTYVKIGRFVWLNAIITVTSQNSSTGGLNLRGFPYDQETSGKPRGGGYICQWYGQPTTWTNQTIHLSMDTDSKCYFRFYNGHYMGDLNGGHLDDSYWFQYVLTYFAD